MFPIVGYGDSNACDRELWLPGVQEILVQNIVHGMLQLWLVESNFPQDQQVRVRMLAWSVIPGFLADGYKYVLALLALSKRVQAASGLGLLEVGFGDRVHS